MNEWEKRTNRLAEGWLVTQAVPKFELATIGRGKVHRINGAIVRWNHLGGTYARPTITYLSLCGRQSRSFEPLRGEVRPRELCSRCEGVAATRPDLIAPAVTR